MIARVPPNRSPIEKSTALNGFAHVEFASTEETVRAEKSRGERGPNLSPTSATGVR